jgi:hypothetical protein
MSNEELLRQARLNCMSRDELVEELRHAAQGQKQASNMRLWHLLTNAAERIEGEIK